MTFKYPSLVLLAFVCAALLAACGSGGSSAEGAGINVVATTTQIGALTRAVAGDNVRLTVLLKAGADAHDYEPDPQAVKAVNQAKVVLRNGIGLDDWLNKTIEAAGGDKDVVVVTDGITTMKATAGDEAGDDDPHVWHDPMNAKIMTANIAKALSTADPAHADVFTANATAYEAKLDQVDAQVRDIINSIPEANRKMVTNHDAFGYFIKRYGLTYVGAVFPVNSKEGETSAKELANLQQLIKSQGVKAVFAEEELDPKVATQLAKDANVKIVTGLYADSLGAKGSGADTVDGMLLSNAKLIAEALR